MNKLEELRKEIKELEEKIEVARSSLFPIENLMSALLSSELKTKKDHLKDMENNELAWKRREDKIREKIDARQFYFSTTWNFSESYKRDMLKVLEELKEELFGEKG